MDTLPAKPESPSHAIVSAAGIEAICETITDGVPMTEIAERIGVSYGTLHAWIAADHDRSARVRESRAATAKFWDEKATQEIRAAGDPFELAKARELAFHYRWRSSKIAPKEYGDKIETTHQAGETIEKIVREIVRPK